MFTKSLSTSRVFLSLLVVMFVLVAYCMADDASGAQQQQLQQQQSSAGYVGGEVENEKRSWNNLQSSWGKRRVLEDSARDLYNENLALNDLLDAMRYNQYEDEDEEYMRPLGQKRAWKNMNGAWGKRVDNWNKFRGAWGKREPGWHNLKGLWGKRDSWNKLQSAWGKRDGGASADNF